MITFMDNAPQSYLQNQAIVGPGWTLQGTQPNILLKKQVFCFVSGGGGSFTVEH